jgi:hypothetical protein
MGDTTVRIYLNKSNLEFNGSYLITEYMVVLYRRHAG